MYDYRGGGDAIIYGNQYLLPKTGGPRARARDNDGRELAILLQFNQSLIQMKNAAHKIFSIQAKTFRRVEEVRIVFILSTFLFRKIYSYCDLQK